MNLGDVTRKTVPKMCLVSAPRNGGSIATAHFHSASRARSHRRAGRGERGDRLRDPGIGRGAGRASRRRPAARIEVEHPTGFFTVDVEVEVAQDIVVRRARRCCAPRASSCAAKCSCPARSGAAHERCGFVCSDSARSGRRWLPTCALAWAASRRGISSLRSRRARRRRGGPARRDRGGRCAQRSGRGRPRRSAPSRPRRSAKPRCPWRAHLEARCVLLRSEFHVAGCEAGGRSAGSTPRAADSSRRRSCRRSRRIA